MHTIYSEDHYHHQPPGELHGGQLVPPFECAKRVEYVLQRIAEVGLGEVSGPQDFGEQPLARIHTAEYLEFLRTCWGEWVAAGYGHQILPTCWPARRQSTRRPNHIDGKVGYHALAAETSMVAGTWRASLASANVALSAAKLLHDGQSSAFGLCRPPGHHATSDMYGGYCFWVYADSCG